MGRSDSPVKSRDASIQVAGRPAEKLHKSETLRDATDWKIGVDPI